MPNVEAMLVHPSVCDLVPTTKSSVRESWCFVEEFVTIKISSQTEFLEN